MEIKIHRGTRQIGGCITEISTKDTRIVIDMGEELPSNDKAPQDIEISGLTQGQKNYDAVFFTHYHGDHIGLYKKILPDIPLYMGEAAKEIYLKLTDRIDKVNLPVVQNFKTYKVGNELTIGDITVTPFLVDHSAYDAYMFLIKADNKTILHTGDFREHGFRGGKLLPMLQKYVMQVDVLITEGTMLSRDEIVIESERQIMNRAEELIKNSEKKYVFVLCSSTNVDRIACFHKANPKGRYFLCDAYQSDVLDVVTKYGANRSDLYDFSYKQTYGSNLDEKIRDKGFCMLVRNNNYFKKVISKFNEDEFLFIYSMWDGYIKREDTKNEKLLEFLNGIDYEILHTSGHATKETIIRVCNIVKPKCIIPIHSEKPEKLLELGNGYNIDLLSDGEVFEVM